MLLAIMKNTEKFGLNGINMFTNLKDNKLESDDKLTIIYDGDSWTFGCEIVNPKISKNYSKDIHPGAYDFLEENDTYRLSRIYPYYIDRKSTRLNSSHT